MITHILKYGISRKQPAKKRAIPEIPTVRIVVKNLPPAQQPWRKRTRSEHRLPAYQKQYAVFAVKPLVKWIPRTMCIQPWRTERKQPAHRPATQEIPIVRTVINFWVPEKSWQHWDMIIKQPWQSSQRQPRKASEPTPAPDAAAATQRALRSCRRNSTLTTIREALRRRQPVQRQG